MLLFELSHRASDRHTSLSENIRIELKFDKALTDAVTCFLYLENDGDIIDR
jgi:hypothetical protein